MGASMRAGIAILLVAGLTLAGCQSTTINVSHAKTDKGYLNSRLAGLGYLFVWNKQTGYVAQIAEIKLTSEASDQRYSELEAREVTGVALSASLNAVEKASIEADIQAKTTLVLSDARVVSFENTFTDLSSEINRRVSLGQDIRSAWFLDDAVKPESPWRYLLIYRAVTADSTQLTFDKSASAGGSISIPTGNGGSVKVTLNGLGVSDFKGDDVTTLVDYYIIRAYIGANPDGTQTYKFKLDDTIPPNFVLSSLLRKL
jgi:hypothetical protein